MQEQTINPQTLLFKDAQTLIEEGWKYVVTDQPVTVSSLMTLVYLDIDSVTIYKGNIL